MHKRFLTKAAPLPAEDLSNLPFLYFHMIFSPSLTAKCGKREIGNKDMIKNAKPKQPNIEKQQTTQPAP